MKKICWFCLLIFICFLSYSNAFCEGGIVDLDAYKTYIGKSISEVAGRSLIDLEDGWHLADIVLTKDNDLLILLLHTNNDGIVDKVRFICDKDVPGKMVDLSLIDEPSAALYTGTVFLGVAEEGHLTMMQIIGNDGSASINETMCGTESGLMPDLILKLLGYTEEPMEVFTVTCYPDPGYSTVEEELWDYEILEDETVRINGYKGKNIDVTVPASLDGHPVSVIYQAREYKWPDKLRSVILPEGLTTIESSTFYNCDNLEKITFPESIRYIGDQAFDGCKKITEIELPEGLIALGNNVFSGCYGLQSISLPSTLTEIGSTPFQSWKDLKTVKVSPENPVLFAIDNVLYNQKELILYPGGKTDPAFTVPDGIIVVGKDAFSFNESLISVVLPESVAVINEGAFIHCENLSSVTLPEHLLVIREDAFSDCRSLTSLSLPGSLVKIDDKAFGYSSPEKLVLTVESGSYAEQWAKQNKIRFTTIPAKSGNPVDPADHSSDWDFGFLPDGTMGITNYKGNEKDLVIPDFLYGYPVISIGSSSFSHISTLKSVTIPEGIIKIDDFAFYECSLESIKLPKSLQYLGRSAFNGCKNLSSVEMQEGPAEIGAAAFHSCSQLKNIIIPEGVNKIGDYAFNYCSNLSMVTLPESLESIGSDAFYHADRILFYLRENSYSEEWAKSNQYKYQYIDDQAESKPWVYEILEDGTAQILGYKLSAAELVIPAEVDGYTVSSVGDNAFEYHSELSSVTISEGITSIGKSAFPYSIKSIKIPNSMTELDWASDKGKIVFSPDHPVFENVDGVLFNKVYKELLFYPKSRIETSYIVPKGTLIINDSAFSGAEALESITLPDGLLSLESYPFYSCNNLETINIPDSLIKIYANPFWGLPNLKDIKISSNHPVFEMIDGVLIDKVQHRLVTYPMSLKASSYTVPDGIRSIGTGAFYRCSLSEVILPESLTTIGGAAFRDSPNLESINIPGSVNKIGDNAFADCPKLKDPVLP